MGRASEVCQERIVEAITTRVRVLREHVDAVRREDPDGIHDMRVASRRLRAALSEYAAFLPKAPRGELLHEARRITRLLGRPRELDVTLGLLARYHDESDAAARAAATTLMDRLRGQRAQLAADCLEAADMAASETIDGMLRRLIEGTRPKGRSVVDEVARRLRRRFNVLTDEYGAWIDTGEREQLHRVRVAFKKFRYACELFTPYFGDRMDVVIQELKQIQEHLGAWNDGRVLLREAGNLPDAPGMDALRAAFEEETRKHLHAFQTIAGDFFSKKRRTRLRRFFRAAQ